MFKFPTEYTVTGIEKDFVYAVRVAGYSYGGIGRKSPTLYFTLGMAIIYFGIKCVGVIDIFSSKLKRKTVKIAQTCSSKPSISNSLQCITCTIIFHHVVFHSWFSCSYRHYDYTAAVGWRIQDFTIQYHIFVPGNLYFKDNNTLYVTDTQTD